MIRRTAAWLGGAISPRPYQISQNTLIDRPRAYGAHNTHKAKIQSFISSAATVVMNTTDVQLIGFLRAWQDWHFLVYLNKQINIGKYSTDN